jgi:hypothetical protein
MRGPIAFTLVGVALERTMSKDIGRRAERVQPSTRSGNAEGWAELLRPDPSNMANVQNC